MSLKSSVCSLLVLVLAGCGGARIASYPYKGAGTPRPGIIYSLPKTYVTATAKFELWIEDAPPAKSEDTTPPRKDGDPARAPDPTAAEKQAAEKKAKEEKKRHAVLVLSRDADGLTVASAERKDAAQRYVLDSKDSAWTDISNHTINVAEDGSLSAVNVTYEDKRADVIGNMVSTAINLAKAAAVKNTERVLRPLKKAETGYTFQATYAAEDLIPPKLRAIGGVKPFESALSQLKNKEPDDLKARYEGFTWLDNLAPEITLRLKDVQGAPTRSANDFLAALTPTPKPTGSGNARQKDPAPVAIPGVVYRVPGTAIVEIRLEDAPVLQSPINVYQFGDLGFIDIRSRAFSNRTQKLGLTKGALRTYEKSATSAAASATAVLKTQSEAVKTAVTDLKTTQAANETKEKAETTAEIKRQRDLRTKAIDMEVLDAKIAANQKKLATLDPGADLDTTKAEDVRLRKEKITLQAEIDALKQSVPLPAP